MNYKIIKNDNFIIIKNDNFIIIESDIFSDFQFINENDKLYYIKGNKKDFFKSIYNYFNNPSIIFIYSGNGDETVDYTYYINGIFSRNYSETFFEYDIIRLYTIESFFNNSGKQLKDYYYDNLQAPTISEKGEYNQIEKNWLNGKMIIKEDFKWVEEKIGETNLKLWFPIYNIENIKTKKIVDGDKRYIYLIQDLLKDFFGINIDGNLNTIHNEIEEYNGSFKKIKEIKVEEIQYEIRTPIKKITNLKDLIDFSKGIGFLNYISIYFGNIILINLILIIFIF